MLITNNAPALLIYRMPRPRSTPHATTLGRRNQQNEKDLEFVRLDAHIAALCPSSTKGVVQCREINTAAAPFFSHPIPPGPTLTGTDPILYNF